MEGLKTNCILYNCIESVFTEYSLFLKVYNTIFTSQQCKICAPTGQQIFPNWEKFVGEPEC